MFDEIQLPTDFSTVTDDQLTELDSLARAAAEPLVQKATANQDLSDDEIAGLERLSTVVTGVKDERNRRLSEASSGAVRAGKAAAAVAAFATDDDKAPEGEFAASDDDADDMPPALKKKLKKPPVSAIAAAADGANGGAAADAVPDEADKPQHYARMIAASGAIGKRAGEAFSDWAEVGRALEESMGTFANLGEGVIHKNPVVQIRREYPPEQRIMASDSPDAIMAKMDALTKRTISPGALTAAAGWCAPSQILYDLYEIENGTDGMVDLPELQISRGGIQFTPGPDFSSIWGGTGYWHQTESQVQAATTKPTMSISCPSFTEKRLEVEGVQITGAFLQDRGYPELVARFGRGAMIAHNRKLNMFVINQVTTNSTSVDFTNVANLPNTTTEYKDLTVVSRALAMIGIQAMEYRYRYRMGFTDTLEVWLPYWFVEEAMADIQRRYGLAPDAAFATTQAMLNDWFSNRNLRVQWLYDWQDAFNTTGVNGATTGVGRSDGTQNYTLPTTVYAVMYAPGTWVKGVSDVIRLDTVYDSTNLALNQYIQLFSEEGILVAKRGYESRLLKLTIDPSGTTSATTNMVTG